MSRHEAFFLIFVLLLALPGCPSEAPQEGGPQDAAPAEELFSGRALREFNISSCIVLPEEDLEGIMGLSPGSTSSYMSGVNLGELVSNICEYKTMEVDQDQMDINHVFYGTDSLYELFTEDLNYTISGKIGEYDYAYVEPGNETSSAQQLLVFVPEQQTLIRFTAYPGFPGADEDSLLEVASLFVSRINFSDSSPHQFTPASPKTTFTDNGITFDYPSNWLVDERYGHDRYGPDQAFIRDSDGILILAVGMGEVEHFGGENGTQEFEDTLDMAESQGAEILHSSVVPNNDGTKTYGYILSDGRKVAIFQYTSPREGGKPIFAIALQIEEDRYLFYETEILNILSSLRAA